MTAPINETHKCWMCSHGVGTMLVANVMDFKIYVCSRKCFLKYQVKKELKAIRNAELVAAQGKKER